MEDLALNRRNIACMRRTTLRHQPCEYRQSHFQTHSRAFVHVRICELHHLHLHTVRNNMHRSKPSCIHNFLHQVRWNHQEEWGLLDTSPLQ